MTNSSTINHVPIVSTVLSDSSISTDSDTEDEREVRTQSFTRISPTRIISVWSKRPTRRLYKFTLFARLKDGSLKPFTFVSERIPRVPAPLYSREVPTNPYCFSLADCRISNSFRSSEHRNVKVLIEKGSYQGKHGVIVKSYVNRGNNHRVLTADGSVHTFKQIHLKRLDVRFLLPFGFPVESAN